MKGKNRQLRRRQPKAPGRVLLRREVVIRVQHVSPLLRLRQQGARDRADLKSAGSDALEARMLLGDYRIEIVRDAEFRLDGGAMFGVVPRSLWSKVCPPDDHNRIRLNMNCLFVETERERILFDTGIGDKWTEKYAAI